MKFKVPQIMHKGLSREQRIFARLYARKAKRFIDDFMTGMGTEAGESVEMANSFFRLLHHKLRLSERETPPDREEVKAAIEQLKDIGRFSVFVTAVIFPGGVLSLLGLELLARKYGIRNFHLLPSSFRKKKNKEKDRDKKTNDERSGTYCL
ncbi:MAG: hypothetical protein PVF73_04380 [Bacteroidales bacterium]|jgi:hypothetical protein